MTTEELALLARNLPQAQSLDLYRLGQAIRMLYSEPKRVVAIRIGDWSSDVCSSDLSASSSVVMPVPATS